MNGDCYVVFLYHNTFGEIKMLGAFEDLTGARDLSENFIDPSYNSEPDTDLIHGDVFDHLIIPRNPRVFYKRMVDLAKENDISTYNRLVTLSLAQWEQPYQEYDDRIKDLMEIFHLESWYDRIGITKIPLYLGSFNQSN